jgi:type IV pilus assembly protein PilQ
LTQIDARRRQVALNVKIVDINLNNIQDYNSSFSFGINDSFFIQDQGAAIMRFGSTSPVRGADINSASGRVLNPPAINNPLSNANTFINPNQTLSVPDFIPGAVFINEATGTLQQLPATTANFFGRLAGVSTNPTLAGITDLVQGTSDVFTRTVNPDGTISTTITRGTLPTATAALPSYFQYPKKFQALIDAQIRSGTAKILTDPTIVVQESQQASVKLVQQVLNSVSTQQSVTSSGAPAERVTTPVFGDVGLTLTIDVDRIDDNGFVSVKVRPIIASPGAPYQFDSGIGTVNTLTPINSRELTSGLVRLRDGQTMILSGIISETDQSTVSKVPILGDIPVLGALFRSSSDQKDRTEVIILLTPQIIDDDNQAQFGYNYSPGREAAGVLRDKGFPVQVQP